MNAHNRLLIACLFGLLPVAVQAATASQVDRIIVKWRSSDTTAAVSAERVRGLSGRLGQQLTRGKTIGGGMSVVRLGGAQQGATLAATLRALRADPDVELAEPDQWMKIQATPSDPLFADSFSFLGQSYERQWYLKSGQIASIRADAAWDITTGGTSPAASPVVIAVLDTGVRLDHPDLAGKLLPGFDFVSDPVIGNDGDGNGSVDLDDSDADPSDPGDFVTSTEADTLTASGYSCEESPSSWHGTRVMGLIAANTNNGVGIAGTGFNVRVVPVRVLGKCGGLTSDVIAGMYWAAGLAPPPPLLRSGVSVNAHPAQVLNLSLGGPGACTATYATAVRDITAHGVLVVVASGNDGLRVGNPASCDGALAVTGIRHVGTKVGYSNLGPEIGIAAPAGNCVFVANKSDPCVFALNTTTNLGSQWPGANDYSGPLQFTTSGQNPTFGTSFSSPLVAGTAGLMKAVNPALTPALLIARIKESARTFPTTSADATTQPPACQLPSVATTPQEAECICNTQVCGAGMLDAHGAVLAAQRPAVFAQVTGAVGSGRQLTLDGSQSAAATGRTIASYRWSVESTSDGAASPTINSATQALATALSPSSGSYTLRLTVTDNLGSSDSAIVTVTAAASTSTSPPPPASSSFSGAAGSGGTGGGGGSLPIPTLLLAAALLLARHLRRCATAQD